MPRKPGNQNSFSGTKAIRVDDDVYEALHAEVQAGRDQSLGKAIRRLIRSDPRIARNLPAQRKK